MSKPKQDGSFPEFIHIATGREGTKITTKAKVKPSHPTPSTPPPNMLYKYHTPTKSQTRKPKQRSILKSPSFKFTGIQCTKKKNVSESLKEASTPTTVGTSESRRLYENEHDDETETIGSNFHSITSSSCGSSTLGSTGTLGTISSEGIRNAIDRIIGEKLIKSSSTITRSVDASDSIDNDSASTSSTANSTASVASTREYLQRCARIKHIEDLNERIHATKARKVVERKAYRRENKLLMKLARQLKTISKHCRENDIHIKNLNQSNQFSEDRYDQTLKELGDLRASRKYLKARLLAENQRKLDYDREERARIIRVQNSELEAHKRSHQFDCQVLCESVLETNNELDRLRALWDEYEGRGSSSLKRKEESIRSKRRTKKSRASWWASMMVVLALVLSIAVFATLAATARTEISVVQEEQQQEQHAVLPPQNIIRSGIIRDENTATGHVHLTIQTSATKTATIALDDENNTVFSGPSVGIAQTVIPNAPARTAMGTGENHSSFPEPAVESDDCESNSIKDDDAAADTKRCSTYIPSLTIETAMVEQKTKREHRFKPKKAVASIARIFQKHNRDTAQNHHQ